MTTAISESTALSLDEVHRFHDLGYLGPFARCSPGEMAEFRSRIESEVLTTDGPFKKDRTVARHLDCRVMYDLIAHPALTERVAPLLGPDIVCWTSRFWIKNPGDGEIAWHQDINYWPLDPPINITAWMAIDDVTRENSCVRIIPGSHKQIVPKRSTDNTRFDENVDLSAEDMSKAIDMVLRPGEFFLFSERLLHQSNPNRSDKRRMGLAVRMTAPFVKVYHDQSPPLFPGHRIMMIRGQDRIGVNNLAQPPAV